MKKIKWLTIWLILSASAVLAEPIAADNPNIQYSGRIDFSNKKAPAISWPGTSIRAKFTGTSLKVKMKGLGNNHMFYVFIDGNFDQGHIITCKKGENIYDVASGLENKTHELLIYKRNDGGAEITGFLGLELDAGAKLETPDPRPGLRMEIFGDSISVGLGCDRKRGKEHSKEATDNFFSYGSITARNIGAEYRCISKSGIGLIKSWWPTIMPQYYNRASANSLEGAGKDWDFSNWQPHLVVINLFQNDSWTIKKPDKNKIITAYKDFVKKIRGHYPKAKIVCAIGSMSANKNKWAGWVKESVTQINDAGDKEVYNYTFKIGTGNRHPNKGDHAKMAVELTTFVKTLDLKPDPPKADVVKTLASEKKFLPVTAKELKMHGHLVSAYKKYKAGKMTKEKFQEGADKIAESLPGTKTAEIAKNLKLK